MTIELDTVVTGPTVDEVHALFEEYAAALGVDLEFQGFSAEVADLPGAYGPPLGRLILARSDGRAAGCVAVRPLELATCEMKRLYVGPAFRGTGLGRRLAQAAIREAAAAGYEVMRLDTLGHMAEARRLYADLGFHGIAPYRHNPVPGAEFLELHLRRPEG